MPYKGITKDTCKINDELVKNKNVILVDDIYTKNTSVIEDCIQLLLDNGTKCVILYATERAKGV